MKSNLQPYTLVFSSLLLILYSTTNYADITIDLPTDIPGLDSSLILTVSRANYKFFTSVAPELDIGIATVLSGVTFTGGFQ